MAPYYESLCKSLDWQVDTDLLSKMKKANEDELKRLDDELEDAEKNLGESEIRDAMMAKAEYLCRIGDKVSEGHWMLGLKKAQVFPLVFHSCSDILGMAVLEFSYPSLVYQLLA